MKSKVFYRTNDATDFITEQIATDYNEATVTVDGCKWNRIGGWCSFFETRNEAIEWLRTKHEERIRDEEIRLQEFDLKHPKLTDEVKT